MSKVTEKDVLEALGNVMDPDLGRDIVSLGFVQDISIEESRVKFRLVLTTPACPLKDKLKQDAENEVKKIEGVRDVEIKMDARTTTSRKQEKNLPDVKHILLVASGKGGVGKSTVAVNIAAGLKKMGASVGIMDADIYGPSIPAMLGLKQMPKVQNERMEPVIGHGMAVMSIGFLVNPSDALIWRGPILHKVLTQFLEEVNWGVLDYLIVDLPPGTGDVQISIAQIVKPSAGILVTTPQDIAFADVRRAGVTMSKVEIPVLGVVENMSHFVCPHCGKSTTVFPSKEKGETAMRMVAPGFMLETLARIPLEPSVALSGEEGKPIVIDSPESETAKVFIELSGLIARKLSILAEKEKDEIESAATSGAVDQD